MRIDANAFGKDVYSIKYTLPLLLIYKCLKLSTQIKEFKGKVGFSGYFPE
jgi:hypothetical protein